MAWISDIRRPLGSGLSLPDGVSLIPVYISQGLRRHLPSDIHPPRAKLTLVFACFLNRQFCNLSRYIHTVPLESQLASPQPPYPFHFVILSTPLFVHSPPRSHDFYVNVTIKKTLFCTFCQCVTRTEEMCFAFALRCLLYFFPLNQVFTKWINRMKTSTRRNILSRISRKTKFYVGCKKLDASKCIFKYRAAIWDMYNRTIFGRNFTKVNLNIRLWKEKDVNFLPFADSAIWFTDQFLSVF